jgi:hypothetical protein
MDVKTNQNASVTGTKLVAKKMNPGLKLLLEMGPLVAFFFTNWKFGIFPATAVLMVAVVVSLHHGS